MKILIVSDYGTLGGGAEHMSVTLRDGLRARGHEARFFATTARPQDAPLVADDTCYGTTGPLRRVLQAANPWAARRLRAVLADFQPDVVHLRLFLTQLSPLILPALRDVPTLFHVVNYYPICPLGTKLLPDHSPCHQAAGVGCYQTGCLGIAGLARSAVQGHLFDRGRDAIDYVVANSHWTRQRLETDGFPVDDVIWNGVPRRPARPPLTSPPTVTFTGRLYAKKGVDVLLDAMAQVADVLPAARLLVAGDGPERDALTRQVAALGLTDHVTMLGQRPRADLETLLADGWVQAVPSRWEEPFGLVAAEAMMRGTAVVASNTGGPSEMVLDGTTGYQVSPNDPDALAAALLRVLRDRAHAEALGQAGRERALVEFTEDVVVERFLALYHDLCEAPIPQPA